MDALFDKVVFSVGRKEYRWGDVVAAARLWGDWVRLRDRAREGIACLARLDEEESAVSDEEIESAADEFRYNRDLVSAQEMEEWLGRWDLTAEGWMDWVRSWTLRQKWSDEVADLVSESPPDEDEVDGFVTTEAVCSGELERLAHRLAGRAAIASKEGGTAAPANPSGVDELTRLELAFRGFRERVLTPAAVEREIRCHRTEWTSLECRYLRFPEEEQAREAALCVREDGTSLDDVAAGAGMRVETERISLADIEPELHDGFLAAKEGDLVGPLKRGEEFFLYLVVDKVLPSVDEAADVQRAEANILDRLIEREINDCVKWAILPPADA